MAKCLVLNAKSLNPYEKRAKLAEVLSSEVYSAICVTETWYNESVPVGEPISDPRSGRKFRYTVLRKDRKDGQRGGGVCIFVRSSLNAAPISLSSEFSALELVACDICSGSNKQRIVCVYRPPSDSASNAKLLRRCISTLCDVPYPVCVTGDFNLPLIDWTNFGCPEDGVHDVLLDCFLSNCLIQYVSAPTRENNYFRPGLIQ